MDIKICKANLIDLLQLDSLNFFHVVRLIGLISKLGLQKGSVLRHMSSVIQPILEKGIVDHSIIHKALVEYFSIADKVFISN